MKKLVALFASAFLSDSVFAADLNGTFQCDDRGKLDLTSSGTRAYNATLLYPDGSASTLVAIEFLGDSLRGTMYRDDEDQVMGTIIETNSGNRLLLRFNSGDLVTCDRLLATEIHRR